MRPIDRRASALALALPALLAVGIDLARRGDRLTATDRLHAMGYVATALASLLCWGGVLFVATRASRWRWVATGLFLFGFGFAGAVQDEFFARYNVYLALDAQLDAESIPWALVGSLPLTGTFVAFIVGWLVLSATCVAIAHRAVPATTISPWLSPSLLVLASSVLCGIPTSYRGVQSSTPDVLYLHALRIGISENAREVLGGTPRPARHQLRRSALLPALAPAPARARNVLVIMQEAVRADVACPDPGDFCDRASAPSHAVTPGRLVFHEMRAVSSSTAVALATSWTGLPATATREALLSAPLIWDYAAAAGYRTGYWTSQHAMFANTRLLIQGSPRDHCVWATHLDPVADYLIGADDELVVHRALDDLDRTEEPFFGVVHLSNVHMPRRVVPSRAPFQPSDERYRRTAEPQQLNYYRNSVHLSELAVAELMKQLRTRSYGRRTVVVYLSDHGEAWFEHDQNNDHGSTLFEEEIRIPLWIDAPEGTLSQNEIEQLQRAAHTNLFQTALTPTLLDLLGVWSSPALRTHVAAMPDEPLTRGARSELAVLTNVSWAWEYGDPNWAVMRGDHKLLATSGSDRYRCFDLRRDPAEMTDLGPAACGELLSVAEDVFGMLPRDLGRLREHPQWGWPRD